VASPVVEPSATTGAQPLFPTAEGEEAESAEPPSTIIIVLGDDAPDPAWVSDELGP
jgi:hypothetical protein